LLSGASPDVQQVDIEQPTGPATILVGGQMPPALTRYELGMLALRFVGPS
jgi:hypothetical protein